MNLSSLKPAAGSVKVGKRVGRGQGSGKGGLRHVDIMVLNLVQDIAANWVLKEARCHFKGVYLNLALTILIELSTKR